MEHPFSGDTPIAPFLLVLLLCALTAAAIFFTSQGVS